MLKIENLHAGIEEKKILHGINLEIKPGEVHAIMGPNGSGKSTLASVLAGRENFEVIEGSVEFLGKDLLELSPEERAGEGLFLGFQYPVEIPGLSTTNFIKTAVALIINGFAKEVMNQLPMEFAVEAQKLLAISLEGSVG